MWAGSTQSCGVSRHTPEVREGPAAEIRAYSMCGFPYSPHCVGASLGLGAQGDMAPACPWSSWKREADAGIDVRYRRGPLSQIQGPAH